MSPILYSKKDINFLLLEGIDKNSVKLLTSLGYSNIKYFEHTISEEKLVELIKDTHILAIRSQTKLPARILKHATKLMAIGCFCVGTDQIDLNYTLDNSIAVFNSPFANTRSVAELIIGSIIAVLRNIPEQNHFMHQNIWHRAVNSASELRKKKLGLIGYGNIGAQIGVLAESLGMQVFFFDTEKKITFGNAKQINSLEDLLATVDIVSLHIPDTKKTKNMFSTKQFNAMKPGSYIINASRGATLDISALIKALETKQIRGAALDVFPVEPCLNKEAFSSPLTKFNNVLLTPHIGGSTIEAQENISFDVIEKLNNFIENGTTKYAVNFPQLDIQLLKNNSRFICLTQKKLNLLNELNSFFIQHKIKVSAIHSQSFKNTTYIIIDFENKNHNKIIESINIKGLIKTRLIL